jgi:hypothetical protein
MLKFLVGPVLVGAGYLTGSIYGADAEQLVHKSPGETYTGVSQAIGNIRSSGMTFFDGGTPMPYEIKVDRQTDTRLLVRLYFDGKQGATADLSFVTQNGGKDTLIVAKVDADRATLRAALAGTSKARLAYAPDWMLNLTAKPLLQQLATQIEQGAHPDLGLTPGEAQAQWEANLTDEQREQVSDWRQYDATRPSVDPDAAANARIAN